MGLLEPVYVHLYLPDTLIGALCSWWGQTRYSHCTVEIRGALFDIAIWGSGKWFPADAHKAERPPDRTLTYYTTNPADEGMLDIVYGTRIHLWYNIWWYGLRRFWRAHGPAPINCATIARELLMLEDIWLPPWICDPDDFIDEDELPPCSRIKTAPPSLAKSLSGWRQRSRRSGTPGQPETPPKD